MFDGLMQLDLPRGDGSAAPGALRTPLVFGAENRLLMQAIDELPLRTAAARFHPLVLVGPAGSGKSQLVQGIVRKWADASRVAYFTAAEFARDAAVAQDEGRLVAWRAAIRPLELLVVEDLEQFRPGSPGQYELRACLDAFAERGTGVVLATADREPTTINSLDPGLRDRLSAGLTVRIERPGPEARRQILQLAASAYGWELAEADLAALSRREVSVASQLFGELLRHFQQRELHAEHAVDNARDAADGSPRRTNFRQILAATARYFGVAQAEVLGHSRKTQFVRARNVVVCLARRLTDLSYASIGHALGGRDHTTVMHAEHRAAQQAAADPTLRQAIEELDRLLR